MCCTSASSSTIAFELNACMSYIYLVIVLCLCLCTIKFQIKIKINQPVY